MILKKNQQTYLEHYSNAQRLGDKPLTQNFVKKKTGETVKYYSSIDAEIYFENIYVDEITDIAFSVEQQAMPLFGYNSYVFDDIAVGARLVNGQFAINFTKAGYMYEVLDTMLSIKQSQQKTTYISKRKPLWSNGFDVYVSYGNAKDQVALKGSSVLVLKNVTLTSESQRFDYTGRPIQEVYTFVAQDIDFLNANEPANETPIEEPRTAKSYTVHGSYNPYKNGHAITLGIDNLIIESAKHKSVSSGLWFDMDIINGENAIYECEEEDIEVINDAMQEDGEIDVAIIVTGKDKDTNEPVEITDNVTLLNTES